MKSENEEIKLKKIESENDVDSVEKVELRDGGGSGCGSGGSGGSGDDTEIPVEIINIEKYLYKDLTLNKCTTTITVAIIGRIVKYIQSDGRIITRVGPFRCDFDIPSVSIDILENTSLGPILVTYYLDGGYDSIPIPYTSMDRTYGASTSICCHLHNTKDVSMNTHQVYMDVIFDLRSSPVPHVEGESLVVS